MCTSTECYYKESKRITTVKAKKIMKGDQSELIMNTISGKCSALIVSALNSMSRGLGSRPDWDNMCCVFGQDT